jgi:hypothetical protein
MVRIQNALIKMFSSLFCHSVLVLHLMNETGKMTKKYATFLQYNRVLNTKHMYIYFNLFCI